MESESKYEEALTMYLDALSYMPRHYNLRKAIGRLYRLSGDNEKSIEIFKQLLLPDPRSGELNLEIAKTYYADGKRKKALGHLETSLDVWKNADATYKPAIEAQTKWNKWNLLN